MAGWNDTIVALATPQGIGAIGVIRLSGERAWEIADLLFPSKDLLSQPTHTMHVGLLKVGTNTLNEVVVSLFKGPRSYTGEDVVEISCHGSPYVLQQVIQACIHHGARMAKPGEYTQRAFLNGKLDLTQAEAVADLIASNTAASQHTALANMRGGFSQILKGLRDQLIKFSALIELELDFSQEDVEFVDRTAFYALIDEALGTTTRLLKSFQLGNVIKNGVKVAIVGKPNAGKSTLLNTLLNENRAIVSDIAGTTRDTIEEVLNIQGILFRLVDTAGIREHTADVIESIGIERSKAAMDSADLIVYLADLSSASTQELEGFTSELRARNKPFILVGNKADLAGASGMPVSAPVSTFAPASASTLDRTPMEGLAGSLLRISAKDPLSVEALKDRMVSLVASGGINTEDVVVTNARHYQALQAVQLSLMDIRTGMDSGLPGDLLALDIRQCLHFLGEITGEVSNEELLGWIFERFCIGK
jgi:tRNA modification GTPase